MKVAFKGYNTTIDKKKECRVEFLDDTIHPHRSAVVTVFVDDKDEYDVEKIKEIATKNAREFTYQLPKLLDNDDVDGNSR